MVKNGKGPRKLRKRRQIHTVEISAEMFCSFPTKIGMTLTDNHNRLHTKDFLVKNIMEDEANGSGSGYQQTTFIS